MVIHIRKRSIGILLVYIVFTIPYIEVNAVRRIFEYAAGDVFVPAAIPFIAIFFIIIWLRNHTGKRKKYIVHPNQVKTDFAFGFLTVFFLFDIFLNWSPTSSYVHLILFSLPFFYAKEAVTFIRGYGLTTEEIAQHGIICFVFEQLVFLVINITVYGFSFSGNAESRIISVGGGPVILGYTVALVVAFWLSCNKNRSKLLSFIILGLSVLIALATGSRGGMWPLFIIVFFHYASRKGRLSSFKIICAFIVVSIILLVVDLNALFPRLFEFSDGGRLTSVSNNLEVFISEFCFFEKMFGKGLGNFYPISKWMIDKSATVFFDYNLFSYNGHSLLVQPHNSFVYSLMEGGIFGLVMYVNVFVTMLKGSLKQNTSVEKKMFVGVSLMVVFFESTFFVSPGSASLWWFILLVYASDTEQLPSVL